MEFTEEAKAAIEDQIQKVVGRMSLSGSDRTEVEKELRSGYYEGAEAMARERGDTRIAIGDVSRALAAEGTPDQIAACYMKSYVGHLRRAGIVSRTIAYLIDGVIIGAGVGALAIALVIVLILMGAPISSTADSGTFSAEMSSDGVSFLVAMAMLLAIMVFFVTAFGYVICYNILLEGYFGRTIGKYIMRLKVLKTDGTKIGYREAILRNIPKYVGNFIFIDALIMLLFFREEKQRAFDKVADTIVVHTN